MLGERMKVAVAMFLIGAGVCLGCLIAQLWLIQFGIDGGLNAAKIGSLFGLSFAAVGAASAIFFGVKDG